MQEKSPRSTQFMSETKKRDNPEPAAKKLTSALGTRMSLCYYKRVTLTLNLNTGI
jgi:hypothetical protein